jgi:serine/threonine protein kinase
MYSEPAEEMLPRILPQYRPLIYQWALHLASGLSFVHSHSVIFGDLRAETCWLSSPPLALSLVGFLDAGYRGATSGMQYNGGSTRDEPFHPCHVPRFGSVVPTMQTDLFLWGCLVYELMTSFWPGHGQGRQKGEMKQMIVRREWPALEREYFGDIVRRCWEYRYQDIASLKRDLITFLIHEGWEIEGEDELRGFRADELFQD